MIPLSIKSKALKTVLEVSSNLSDKNLVRILSIGGTLVRDERTKSKIDTIKECFENGHPSVTLVRNTISRLSPNCKSKLLENFFTNAVVAWAPKQAEIKEKYGVQMPWFFVISPSAKCNLKCKGCYASEYSMEDELSFEEVDKIMTEAKELGIHFITVTGGEPFAWPHLLKIFEKHNDMYFQVYTNGIWIDKEMASKLSELGNVTTGISLEGFEKETDDRRGEGTFQKVMQAMDNLKEAGVMFGFSATPTKYNTEVLMSDEFIDLMISKGCSFGWFFQYVPIGRKPDVSMMSTPEQRNKLRMRIGEIRSTKPIFVGDFWNDGPHVGGCMAGARPNGYFHINCQGDVEPCAFLQFSVDNIKGKKLIDVIQSPFFKAIQEAQPYCDNKNLLMPCALIDHPEILRDVVEKYNAKPSYNSSYDTVHDPKICKFLDNYSAEMKKLTDPVWDTKLSKRFKHWKDRRQNKIKD